MSNNDPPERIPATDHAPSRENYLGEITGQICRQICQGDSRESGEDIVQAFAEDASEKFQASSPAAVDEQPVTGLAERQTVLKNSSGLCGHVLPLDRAISRQYDLGSITDHFFWKNARGPVEDIAHAFAKDFAAKLKASSPSGADKQYVTALAERQAILKPFSNLSGNVPPQGRASSREKDFGDMPAQHLEGNARGPVKDLAHGFEEAMKYQAPSPSAVDEQPTTGPAERQVMLDNSSGLCGREPATVCAPCRVKDSGDVPAQHLEGNARDPVQDIVEASGKVSAQNFQAPSPSGVGEQPVTGLAECQTVFKALSGLSGHIPPNVCASPHQNDSGDMPAKYLGGGSQDPFKDIVEDSGKDFAVKFRALSRSTGDIYPVTGSADRAAVLSNPSGLSGHVLPLNRAPYCQNDVCGITGQICHGNACGHVEDITHAFAEDFDGKFQVSSPCAVDDQSVIVLADRVAASNDSTSLSGHVPPTGRAPYREKYLDRTTGGVCQGNSCPPVEDLAHTFAEDVTEKLNASSRSTEDIYHATSLSDPAVVLSNPAGLSGHIALKVCAVSRQKVSKESSRLDDVDEHIADSADCSSTVMNSSGLSGHVPPTDRANSRQKYFDDLFSQDSEGNTRESDEDIDQAMSNKNSTEKFLASSNLDDVEMRATSAVDCWAISKDSAGLCRHVPPPVSPSSQHLKGNARTHNYSAWRRCHPRLERKVSLLAAVLICAHVSTKFAVTAFPSDGGSMLVCPHMHAAAADTLSAHDVDIMARSKAMLPHLTGDTHMEIVTKINSHVQSHPKYKLLMRNCSEFSSEELDRIFRKVWCLRSKRFKYTDGRELHYSTLREYEMNWAREYASSELNSQTLIKGKCAHLLMVFTHHLSSAAKASLREAYPGIHIPTLPLFYIEGEDLTAPAIGGGHSALHFNSSEQSRKLFQKYYTNSISQNYVNRRRTCEENYVIPSCPAGKREIGDWPWCEENSCTCSGGTGATGTACPTHNTAKCA
jgi:hypothetical protein